MEQQKRRNFLIGFAGLAIVIAVAVAVILPKFPPEQASGAIGAVQKHHETQISAKDVILGDESVKKQNDVVFADYLSDSTKLQSFSANLGSVVVFNRDQLNNVAHDLQSHQSDLQSRYESNMQAAVGSISEILNKSNLGSHEIANINAELQSINSELNSRLNSSQMDALNSRLNNVASDLQSRLNSRTDLAGAQAQLNAAATELQNHTDLNDKAILGAAEKLANVAEQLNDKATLGVRFSDRSEYLNNITLQSKTLDNVQASLNSILMSKIENKSDLQSRFSNAASDLASQANHLESQALGNMQDRLNNESQMASMVQSMNAMVGSMQQFNSKTLGSKTLGSKTLGSKTLDSKTLGSFATSLNNVASALQSFDTHLQAQAQANMQAELGAISEHLQSATELQSRFANAADLGSKVENRADLGSKVENRADLGSKVENRADLGSKVENRADLGSKVENRADLGSKVENRADLGSRLNSQANLGSKVENKANLGSRFESKTLGSKIENKTLGSFQSYLNNMAQTLQSSTLGSRLQNRQDLANKAQTLGSKSADLQSRSN